MGSQPIKPISSAGTRRALLRRLAQLSLASTAVLVSGCGWRLKGLEEFAYTRVLIIGPGQAPQLGRRADPRAEGKADQNTGPELNDSGSPLKGETDASPISQQPQPRYVQAVDNASLVGRLRRIMGVRYRLTLVETAREAEVIFRILSVDFKSTVVAFSGSGRPREAELQLTVRIRAEDATGRPIIPADTLISKRRQTYNENDVLGSQAAEAAQRASMDSDMVDTLVRRMAVLKPSYAAPLRPPSS